MAKAPILTDITSLANVQSALATMADNNAKIEEAFQNTLSRDGSLPNQMEAAIDMNSHRIINVADPLALGDALNLRTLGEYLGGNSPISGAGVVPKKWDIVGDGVTVNFPIPGADAGDPLFFICAFETEPGSGVFHKVLEPVDDFTVQVDSDDFDISRIIFNTPPANGANGFVMCLGFARPYTGLTPIDTTAGETVINNSTTITVGKEYQNAIIYTTADVPVTITVDTGWESGQYFSVVQLGQGKVTIAGAGGIVVTPPSEFTNATRAQYATINVVCKSPSEFVTNGDLQRIAAEAILYAFCIDDKSALNTTALTATTNRGYMHAPFGFKLVSIAEGGCVATLRTAQASGSILTVDVNKNGTSIFATRLTFDNTENTTRTATTPAVYAAGGDTFAKGDVISFDVDQIGTSGANGLQVWLLCQRTD